MNPSCTKLISRDAVQDQSLTKELSQAMRKRTKGKNGFYFIEGMSLFANILEKSGTVPSTEKKGDGKEALIHAKGKLTSKQNILL